MNEKNNKNSTIQIQSLSTICKSYYSNDDVVDVSRRRPCTRHRKKYKTNTEKKLFLTSLIKKPGKSQIKLI